MEIFEYLWNLLMQSPTELSRLIHEWVGVDISPDDIKIVIPLIIVLFALLYLGVKSIVRKRELHKWHLAQIEEKLECDFASYANINKYSIKRFFSFKDKTAEDIYIETRFQSKPPYDTEEPQEHIFTEPSESLMKFYLSKALTKDNTRKFLFCVLADSGMGKTTFAINLLKQYILKYTQKTQPYDIFLLSLSKNNAFEKIEQIDKEKRLKSILILDALDENTDAVEDFSKFQEKLENITEDFRFIIITCRTQFFSTKNDEPKKSLIRTVYQEGKRSLEDYTIHYISVFNNKDINNYLEKKYHSRKKREKAMQIVSMCKNLMVRPMLLSYIDDLLQENEKEYKYLLDIYEVLIDKWLDREINYWETKNPRSCNLDELKKSLYDFSQKLAIHIYQKRIHYGGLFIPRSDLNIFMENNNFMMNYSYTGRSLVNRDSYGNVKFAHKSFLEYFLALQKFQENDCISFDGMDLALDFYKSLCIRRINYLQNQSIIEYDEDSKRILVYNRIDEYLRFFTNIKEIFISYYDVNDSFFSWIEQNPVNTLVLYNYEVDGVLAYSIENKLLTLTTIRPLSLVIIGNVISFDLYKLFLMKYRIFLHIYRNKHLSLKEDLNDILNEISIYQSIDNFVLNLKAYYQQPYSSKNILIFFEKISIYLISLIDEEIKAHYKIRIDHKMFNNWFSYSTVYRNKKNMILSSKKITPSYYNPSGFLNELSYKGYYVRNKSNDDTFDMEIVFPFYFDNDDIRDLLYVNCFRKNRLSVKLMKRIRFFIFKISPLLDYLE